MSYRPIGEVAVYVGDPTTAAGADMTDCGLIGTAAVSKQLLQTIVAPNGIEDADGYYGSGAILGVQINLHDQDTDILAAILPEATKVGDSLGFGKVFTKENPPTICILPKFDIANGVDSLFAIWLPAYRVSQIGDETYNPSVNQGVTENPLQITLNGMRRQTDQLGATIPVTAQPGFRGTPSDFGLTWFLP